MERNQPIEGGQRGAENSQQLSLESDHSHDPTLAPFEGHLNDAQLIYLHITEALREGRPIDDATARAIAAGLHDGQSSSLYALASSGAVVDGLSEQLERCRADTALGLEVEPWLDALDEYLNHRDNPDPIEGWADLWPAQPQQAQSDEEAEARTELVDRISAAGMTTLGQVATISTPDTSPEDDETDRFPWRDAAHWRPGPADGEDHPLHPEFTDEELDALFGDGADADIGTTEELGWFGMVRWRARDGGLILSCDSLGRRHTWVTATNELLERRWEEIRRDYEAFYEQRDAYEEAIREPEDSTSGLHPRVWVGSLADYNGGNLHGAWFDATREPAELELAARYILRTGENRAAEEWAVMDYDDFAGVRLEEHTSFAVISRVARGIAEHGEAFGHWASHIGSEDLEQLEVFEDHYHGEWESFEAYIEDYLEETGFYGFMDTVPEEMRGYVEVDVAGIARDWGGDFLVIELRNGRVAVVDTSN